MNTLELNQHDITFINQSCSKQQAIKTVAENMIAANLVKTDYVQAMFDRDEQISTFLGNGIAIPHGTTEKRDSVLKTGVHVLFCPQGIVWDDEGNIAYVIIGIAAKANEHLNVLRQLTHAVIAEDTLARIKKVQTPADLLAILQAQND
ncbi:phosphocarrier protein FPr [Orbus hercynius]|uniref:Phosphocarrier protein FPr n=1 Tax=Orbus hercynius TaxID=593135 RepID=A0A495RF05_9GAMM|nr:PTS sugar transporter subunit IIA [Orbus hercynius]RKS86073.1 phosphocarrier protein FPr [Orbus hercynius]